MNSLYSISPYRSGSSWVFDDPARQILAEPFVAGADQIMEFLSGGRDTFTIIFAEYAFPSVNHHLAWLREESGGNIYRHEESGIEGWLCPVLLVYFPVPPQRIYLHLLPGGQHDVR